MRQVTLGKSGLVVSAVGFGGIPIMRLAEPDAVGVIRRALELGINFIDTAAGYGDSQAKVGQAIAGRRDGLVLASKSGERTREGMQADVERARREMGVETIDLFQFHGVSTEEAVEQMLAPGGALEALLAERDRGHIAHIGYSSHNLDTAMQLVDHPDIETVQFPFNLVMCEPGGELIPAARANGLGFIVMKPLCGGQFHDANLAFKFLNAYPDLVPIPGIERTGEIEEIVEIVEAAQTLRDAERVEADKVVAELGKLFCRRCGYCEPCPEGVPLALCMNWESFMRRLSRERIVKYARQIVVEAAKCDECGECETKCPYDLPIVVTVKKSIETAREILEGGQ